MSGLLQSVESAVGSFVSLIREDGQPEQCEVVAPSSGGGALAQAYLSLVTAGLVATSGQAADSKIFTACVALATDFQLADPAGLWTLGPNGVLTLGGTAARLVSACCSLSIEVQPFTLLVYEAAALALNGDLLGLSLVDPAGVVAGRALQTVIPGPAGANPQEMCLSTNRQMTMVPGDTLQPVFCNLSDFNISDILLDGFGLSLFATPA